MIIMIFILIFFIVFIFGSLIGGILEQKRSNIGTIVVIKKEDRILYSLEMNDSPEKLQFKKKAYFRVKISEEESDRI